MQVGPIGDAWRYVVRDDLRNPAGGHTKPWHVCRSYIYRPDPDRYGPPISWHASRAAATRASYAIEQAIQSGEAAP